MKINTEDDIPDPEWDWSNLSTNEIIELTNCAILIGEFLQLPRVWVKTCDEVTYSIFHRDAEISGLLSLASCSQIGRKKDDPYPLQAIRSQILEKIIEYLTHHKGKASEDFQFLYANSWDGSFWDKMQTSIIADIVRGSNYLGIPGLFSQGCAKISLKFSGGSTHKMQIQNFLTRH